MRNARNAAAPVGDRGVQGGERRHPQFTTPTIAESRRAWHYVGAAAVARVGGGRRAHGRWYGAVRTLCGRTPTLVLDLDYNPTALLLSGHGCLDCKRYWHRWFHGLRGAA